jgi:hypothetical protein
MKVSDLFWLGVVRLDYWTTGYDVVNGSNEILVGMSAVDTPGFSLGILNFNLKRRLKLTLHRLKRLCENSNRRKRSSTDYSDYTDFSEKKVRP